MQISLQLRAIFRPVYGSLVLSSIGIGETFTWTDCCGWDRWSLQSPHLFSDTKLACAVWPHGSSFPFPAWDSDQASLGRRELLLLPRAGWAGTRAWAVAGLSPGSSPRSPTLALEVDACQKWGVHLPPRAGTWHTAAVPGLPAGPRVSAEGCASGRECSRGLPQLGQPRLNKLTFQLSRV